jgi:hypothetical protein
MTETEITQDFPVKELAGRYSISRSTAYLRLKQLQIEAAKKPSQNGVESFLNPDQLRLMDKYDLLAGQGRAKLDPWLNEIQGNSSELTPLESNHGSNDLLGALMAIAQRLPLKPSVVSPPSLTLKDRMETLQAACENEWLLSTAELGELILAKTIPSARYGFRFDRAGRHSRGAIAWKIVKA